jgi:hypothetical protein
MSSSETARSPEIVLANVFQIVKDMENLLSNILNMCSVYPFLADDKTLELFQNNLNNNIDNQTINKLSLHLETVIPFFRKVVTRVFNDYNNNFDNLLASGTKEQKYMCKKLMSYKHKNGHKRMLKDIRPKWFVKSPSKTLSTPDLKCDEDINDIFLTPKPKVKRKRFLLTICSKCKAYKCCCNNDVRNTQPPCSTCCSYNCHCECGRNLYEKCTCSFACDNCNMLDCLGAVDDDMCEYNGISCNKCLGENGCKCPPV